MEVTFHLLISPSYTLHQRKPSELPLPAARSTTDAVCSGATTLVGSVEVMITKRQTTSGQHGRAAHFTSVATEIIDATFWYQ